MFFLGNVDLYIEGSGGGFKVTVSSSVFGASFSQVCKLKSEIWP